jgi:amino acid transporter
MTLHHTGKFGTAPVFFTAISTILGAILFLRFGFAVGQLGFVQTLLIVLIGHMVTIPTAMAIAEIATNQKVEGGGEYFIISRSFGLVIGSTIGLALYLSQAISVAFYVIAFSEAFDPVIRFLHYEINTPLIDKRWIGLLSMSILSVIILTRGANMGMKALYWKC